MSYSSAVKGRLTRSTMKYYVLSQAELELGRPLNREEDAMMCDMFSIQDIFNRIHKVRTNHSIFFSLHISILFSMAMVLSSFCYFCAPSLTSDAMFHRMLHQGMETAFFMVINFVKWILDIIIIIFSHL